ncbi:MAG: hypothetical protein H6737_01895 [Alphaproteobacteria bacterium]|nr:hypothetical protein [Alphaproteobacteria bacterium]
MAFEDRQLDDHPWTWGAIAMLAAGFAHLGTIVMQVVVMGGLGTWIALNDPNTNPVTLLVFAAWLLAPTVGTLVVVALQLLGARTLRFQGPGPLVWVALAGGVFWPMVRMGLAMLACNVFEAPVHLVGALASLAATVIVAVDPSTRQLHSRKPGAD